MSVHLPSLLVIAIVAVLAPLVAELPLGVRLPIVVLEVFFGTLVGPYVLHLADATGVVGFLGRLGLAFLIFLAGLEIDFAAIRGRPAMLAAAGWGLSLVLAMGITAMLAAIGIVRAPLLVGVALTTTAMGTLLPVLRDAGELETTLGRYLMAAGAAGEFGPIVVISLLFSEVHGSGVQTALLMAFVAVSILSAALALRLRTPKAVEFFARTIHASSQLPVRICILALIALLALAEKLGLDMILGAFAAGMVVNLASYGRRGVLLREKLDAIGFGFLVPMFFVTSGMRFDPSTLLGSPTAVLRLPLFLMLMLLVRGVPTFLYRRDLGRRERWPFALLSATALPLVVAIANVGLSTGRMFPENAAALIGAGMLSVLLFPTIALVLRGVPLRRISKGQPVLAEH